MREIAKRARVRRRVTAAHATQDAELGASYECDLADATRDEASATRGIETRRGSRRAGVIADAGVMRVLLAPRQSQARSPLARRPARLRRAASMTEFVHLHVHSQYSMLDGAVKVKDLVKRVADAGDERGRAHRPRQHVRRDPVLQGLQGGGRQGDPRRASSRSSSRARHGHHLAAARGDGGGLQEPRPARLARATSSPIRAGRRRPVRPARARSRARRRASSALTGLHGRRRRAEHPRAGRRGRARRRSTGCASSSSPGSLYVELQDHGLAEQPVLNGILVDARAATSACRSSRRTTSTSAGARTARRSSTSRASRANRSYAEALERAPRQLRDVPEDRPTRWRTLFRDRPEARHEHARDRRDVRGLKLKLGKPDAPELRRARRADDADSYFRHVAARGPRARASPSSARVGQEGRRGRVPQRASRWSSTSSADEVPGLLPHRLGLHPLREGERHPGRAGPRLGRRLARRVRACGSPISIPSRTTCSSSAS